MSIAPRQYTGDDDLRKIQSANTNWIASAGFCGYLHVGDIGLRLFNGMRQYKPQEIVRLWEDADGSLLAWAMIYPRWNSYEAQLQPSQRGGDLERDILDWCEREASNWMRREGRNHSPINVEIFEDDLSRIALLEQRGYTLGDDLHVTGERRLDEAIPDVPLPEGFSIRPVEGLDKVDRLVAVMNAAFGWSWTPEAFGQVMQSPGYKLISLLIVVAPDGTFAAFCSLMLDTVNGIGMFEDVGTHPGFQRRGLGRALLYGGMKHMAARGMEVALVPYHPSVKAASALYASVGFRPRYNLYSYRKTF